MDRIATEYFDWSSLADTAEYNRCSPNLLSLSVWAIDVWSLEWLGCYGERPVRGGERPSPHSHGAAVDLGYGPGADRRELAVDMIIPTLIRNSEPLHVQRICDYIGRRIWTAGRTAALADAETRWWKPNKTAAGMGQRWATYLHVEVNRSGWDDTAPLEGR